MLEKAFHSLRHNIELYATFAVCGFLLVLKVLHLVDDHWIDSAILVTLMLIALGTLRDRASEKEVLRAIEVLQERNRDEDVVKWYIRRLDATADMLADMDQFSHLVFLGISHRQLSIYLREKLQHSNRQLPWKTVEVYFAPDLLGEAYEGQAFARRLENSRKEIAMLLTDPMYTDSIPRLRYVSFFQQDGLVFHTGSMFGSAQEDLSVIYAVHSTVRLHGDTHQGLTIRLDANRGSGDPRFDHYNGLYRMFSQSSRSLGRFTRTIWDQSAQSWHGYARTSTVLSKSMGTLRDLVSKYAGDSILDLGAGSGDTSETIIHGKPDAEFVLLDGSPQMVRLSRETLDSKRTVRFALCQLPPNDREDIDLRDERFATILIHQCLGDFVKSFGTIENLAAWCRGRLLANGCVIIAAHNGNVNMPRPKGFEEWTDPFRTSLLKEFNGQRKYRQHLRTQGSKLSPNWIEAGFAACGFTVKHKTEEEIELSYEDRRNMWRVPAVMDSMIDMEHLHNEPLDKLVDYIVAPLKAEKTMPRTMKYWVLCLDQ